MTVKTYNLKYTTVKVNEQGLHVQHCKQCDNQLNYLLSDNIYDTCKQYNFNCKQCNYQCTGLTKSWETGWEERTTHGYCKKCGTYIEY